MNKKIRVLIVIAILIMLTLVVKSTYSKYTNLAVANVEENVGNWIIKINDKDVTTVDAYGNFGVFEIDDFTWNWSESPHVKEPKVAPGMKGYFDLKIDPTGTDVSIKYTLTIDDSKIAEMLGIAADEAKDRINLKMTGIVENGVEIELPRDEDGNIVITKIKTLEQIKSENESDRIDNLEVEVTWENNEDNNDIDSQIGSVANSTIKLPVKVDVIQWTGE